MPADRPRFVASLLVLTVVSVVGLHPVADPPRARASSLLGGHPLEFGLSVGYTDFDADIRFENDAVYGMALAAGIVPWLRLGLELSHTTSRDREQANWVSAITAGIMSRVEPWSSSRLSVGALLGVSFMGFEESPDSDSISEGLDLGPTLTLSLSSRWLLRGDLFWRMQTFRLVPVDSNGTRTAEREETGYLWSRVFRLGLSHVF